MKIFKYLSLTVLALGLAIVTAFAIGYKPLAISSAEVAEAESTFSVTNASQTASMERVRSHEVEIAYEETPISTDRPTPTNDIPQRAIWSACSQGDCGNQGGGCNQNTSPIAQGVEMGSPFLVSKHFVDDYDFQSQDCCNISIDTCQLIFGAAVGDYIGIRRGYSEFGVFTAFTLDDHLHGFVDAREFHLHDNQCVGSLGVGIREPIHDCAVIGANLYYDYLDSCFHEEGCRTKNCRLNNGLSRVCSEVGCEIDKRVYKTFSRIGIGLEYLSDCFDARFNSYIPVGRTSIFGHPVTFTWPEGWFSEYRTQNFFRWGLDAELGRTLSCWNCFSTYLALGGYYYDHKSLESIYGPMARFEVAWQRYLTVQVTYTYDREFQSRAQGKILFSIPLEDLFQCLSDCFCGSCPCDNQYCRLVRRNYVPFLDRRCCWDWNW
jgi:hypothetical protein